jgi:hypothetical protein
LVVEKRSTSGAHTNFRFQGRCARLASPITSAETFAWTRYSLETLWTIENGSPSAKYVDAAHAVSGFTRASVGLSGWAISVSRAKVGAVVEDAVTSPRPYTKAAPWAKQSDGVGQQ